MENHAQKIKQTLIHLQAYAATICPYSSAPSNRVGLARAL